MSEPVNDGNGAASGDGAGSAGASTGTGSGDAQPSAAGAAPAQISDESAPVTDGNGAASGDGAGSAGASTGTRPGNTQPSAGSGAAKATSYLLSSVKWVGGFIKENPELISRAATALANREQRLSEEDAEKEIKRCLTEIQQLALPLGEHIRLRWRLRASNLYLINRSIELEGHYIRIRAELLESVTTIPDRATDSYALSAAKSLELAYKPLMKRESLNAAANYLSQADAFTASILTKTQAVERAKMLLAFLDTDSGDDDDGSFQTSLKDVVGKCDELGEETVKGNLVAVIRRQWAVSCSSHLAEDLQEARMKSILRWLTAALVGLIIIVPLVIGLRAHSSAAETIFVWPMLRSFNAFVQSYIVVLAIALIGCVGGTLSALLAARDSRTRLQTYRTDMQRALMKPIMGAVLAVLVYAFLTWQVIPGVKVTNAGTYLFFALLAGFSERFFLRLLPLQESSPEDGVAYRDRSPKIV